VAEAAGFFFTTTPRLCIPISVMRKMWVAPRHSAQGVG
jgi:hypothetical protein